MIKAIGNGVQLFVDGAEGYFPEEFIVRAVAKQIPRKVGITPTSKVKALDVEREEIYTYPVVRCPLCNIPMILNKERKFCDHCGQALDWSEGE